MQPTKSEMNAIIETLHQNNMDATEIHGVISTAWGAIISVRRIREIAKEFKDGVRNSFERKFGSGRPSDPVKEDVTPLIMQHIIEDNGITIRELAQIYDISKDMVWRILTKYSKMKTNLLPFLMLRWKQLLLK